MKILEFREGLTDLQNALRKWGAVKQAGELETLVAALAEFDELTISELSKRVKAINTPTRAPKAPKQVDTAVVERYLATLKAAAHSSETFERAVEQVVEDKKHLPPAELKELARLFGGSVPSKSSRRAIAEFLKARRLEMRRQEGLGATIDRMLGRT
jgi:hypothetical protein